MLFWIRTVELSLCWIPSLLLSPHQPYIVHVPLPPPLSQLDTPAFTHSITAYSYNTANTASIPSSNFYSSNTANPASTTFSNFYSSNYVLKLPLLLTQPTQFSLPPQTSTSSNTSALVCQYKKNPIPLVIHCKAAVHWLSLVRLSAKSCEPPNLQSAHSYWFQLCRNSKR